MSSILTNHSAMTALSTLRNISNNLTDTQSRISTGLKIASGKDNAAYFSISKTMSGDSGMFKAIDETLTLQKNAISTARLGAETIASLANDFAERVAFAQGGTEQVRADVQLELDELVARIQTTIDQSATVAAKLPASYFTPTSSCSLRNGSSTSPAFRIATPPLVAGAIAPGCRPSE